MRVWMDERRAGRMDGRMDGRMKSKEDGWGVFAGRSLGKESGTRRVSERSIE